MIGYNVIGIVTFSQGYLAYLQMWYAPTEEGKRIDSTLLKEKYHNQQDVAELNNQEKNLITVFA